MRHRAPLFIAQVDPERLHVIRATERVLVPERGAELGNFGAAAITDRESWVTVAEGVWNDESRAGREGGRVRGPGRLGVRPWGSQPERNQRPASGRWFRSAFSAWKDAPHNALDVGKGRESRLPNNAI